MAAPFLLAKTILSETSGAVIREDRGKGSPLQLPGAAYIRFSRPGLLSALIILSTTLLARGVEPALFLPLIAPAQAQQPSLGSFPVHGQVAAAGAPVRVYKAPDRNSSVLGFAVRGINYPLIVEGSTWYGINFHNAMGWVEATAVSKTGVSAAPPRPAPPAPQPPVVAAESVKAQTPPEAPAPEESPADEQPAVQTPPAGPPPESEPRAVRQPRRRREEPAPQAPEEPAQGAVARSIDFLKKVPLILPGAIVPEPPQPPAAGDSAAKPRLVEVIGALVPVYAYLAPDAPTIMVAHRGDRLRLVAEGRQWHRVAAADTVGWVERIQTREWVRTPATAMAERLPLISILILVAAGIVLIGVIIAIIVTGFLLARRIARMSSLKGSQGRNCLIIAAVPKRVEYSFSEKTIPLDRCFTEIGFKVTTADDLVVARSILVHYLPEVVCVDWALAPNIHDYVGRLLSERTSTASALVIFYNVPYPAGITPTAHVPNVHYMGIRVTDADLMRYVTPRLVTGKTSKIVKKSVESHALEGEVTQESLSEVLQFVEIGRKKGCLLLDKNGPYGMLYFEEGRIVYARTPTTSGMDAVRAVLDMTEGHFSFVSDKAPPAKEMDVGTLGALMEWTRIRDESARDRLR